MTNQEIMKEVAEIHNLIATIYVRNDDTIVMGQAIMKARNLCEKLRAEDASGDKD